MSVQPILIEPNEYLHKVCEPVTKFDDELKKLVDDLLDTVRNAKDPEGAGLAAPQIGVLKRVCIAREFIDSNNDENSITLNDIVLINPEFIKISSQKDVGWEGCLSIPDTYALVERPINIKIKAYNVNGSQFKLKADAFLARVIQHEMDHLDGKIILDQDRQIGKTLNQKEFDKLLEQKSTL